MKAPTLEELITRSKAIYPTSRYLAYHWVRKSYTLYSTGKHRLQMDANYARR